MKSKLTLLILLLAVLTSCKKTTNLDVTISISGKLSYKLLDDAGKGIPNVKISLFDEINPYSNIRIELETGTSDQNGVVNFGDLNPKTYYIVADSPMVNNIKYNIQDYVQVVAGTTKNKEAKVSDYSGTYNFTTKSTYNNEILRNVGVLMVPANKFNYYLMLPEYLKIADFKGVSNNAGLVSFKVPCNKDYLILTYNISNNTLYPGYSYQNIQRNATTNTTLLVYNQ